MYTHAHTCPVMNMCQPANDSVAFYCYTCLLSFGYGGLAGWAGWLAINPSYVFAYRDFNSDCRIVIVSLNDNMYLVW